MLTTAKALFPLGANLAPSDEAVSMSVEDRLKQVLVLCEEVVLEIGGIRVLQEGGSVWVHRLAGSFALSRRRPDSLREVAALDALALIPTELLPRYPWLRLEPGAPSADVDVEAMETFDDLLWPHPGGPALVGDLGAAERSFGELVLGDVARGAAMDVSVAVDERYEALLAKEVGAREFVADSYHSIRLPVPDVTALTWEEIAELRSHPSLSGFRRRLLEGEWLASGRHPSEAQSALSDSGFYRLLGAARTVVNDKGQNPVEFACYSSVLPPGLSRARRREWTAFIVRRSSNPPDGG